MELGLAEVNPRYVNNGDSREERATSGESEKRIQVNQAFGEVFSDYLNVTFEREVFEVSVVPEVRKYLDVLQASEQDRPFASVPYPAVFLLADKGGSFKLSVRGKVGIVSASGGALALLRASGLFGEYLAMLGSFPHRVSMLHVTQDFYVDSPGVVVREVLQRGYAGQIALTRKAIRPEQVRGYMLLRPDGGESGTVYLGHRANADVWGKVYDKQLEQVSRGFPDPGPLVRVEIAVQSDVGATLRDAYSPSCLFWHFASGLVGGRPFGVSSWSPHGEGFTIPKREFSPSFSDRVQGILSGSPDVQRVLELARQEFGDEPEQVWDALMPEFRLRCRQKGALTGSGGVSEGSNA